MDIEKSNEVWNNFFGKSGFGFPKEIYDELYGGEFNSYHEETVKMLLEQFFFSSIDAWLESMPKEVKKEIMQMGWNEDKNWVSKFLNDTYNSDGEFNMDGQNPTLPRY